VERLLRDFLRVITLSSPQVEVADNVIRVVVEEDRAYRWGELEDAFRLRGFSQIYSDFECSVKNFLKSCARLVAEAFRECGLEVFDVSLPRVGPEKVLFGEFVGEHVIGFAENKAVVLVVEPKVGWSAYAKMLRESLEIPAVLGSREALKPLLANTTVFGIYSPISYSLLLIELTHQALSAPLPRAVEVYKVVSSGVVGKPDYHDTYVLMSRELPLAVFKRFRIRVANAPLMLLARFHAALIEELQLFRDRLMERFGKAEKFIDVLVAEVENLIDIHRALLWATELKDYLIALYRMGIDDSKLVAEAYRQAGFNTLLKQVVDLFIEFQSRAPLVHKFGEEKLSPVPSSKIYELWVLRKIIDYMKSIGREPRLRRGADMYMAIEANGFTIEYNMPKRKKLKIAGIAPKASLRPDYLIEYSEGRAVLDAKYRRVIELEDIERLATYIIEFAKPVKGKLYGAIITLQDTRVRKQRGARDRSLGTEIEVEVLRVDPRQGDQEVMNTLSKAISLLI